MTGPDDAIIRPVPLYADHIGKTVVLVSTRDDLLPLCDSLGIKRSSYTQMFMSRIYHNPSGANGGVSLVGPVIGAPYAALLAEMLIVSGADRIIFYGWCGSVSPDLHTGHVLLPEKAVAEEGVAGSYIDAKTVFSAQFPVAFASAQMNRQVASAFENAGIAYDTGTVWTTGAIFRETMEKIRFFQKQNVVAVDMESSAVFAVARFRGAEASAVLVVSDELFDFTWRPGFGDKRFIDARSNVSRVIAKICRTSRI